MVCRSTNMNVNNARSALSYYNDSPIPLSKPVPPVGGRSIKWFPPRPVSSSRGADGTSPTMHERTGKAATPHRAPKEKGSPLLPRTGEEKRPPKKRRQNQIHLHPIRHPNQGSALQAPPSEEPRPAAFLLAALPPWAQVVSFRPLFLLWRHGWNGPPSFHLARQI